MVWGGKYEAPLHKVPYGHRHEYLRDFAVRLLRGGFVDGMLIAYHLRCEFERKCVRVPDPEPGYL